MLETPVDDLRSESYKLVLAHTAREMRAEDESLIGPFAFFLYLTIAVILITV